MIVVDTNVIALVHEAQSLVAPRGFHPQPDPVLRLAAGSRCTATDRELVVAAQDLGLPLVTCDRQVIRAFPAVAVSPNAFVAACE